MPINAIYNKLLLTSLARYVGMYREISDLGPFVQTSPELSLYKKDLGPIFLCTDLAFG